MTTKRQLITEKYADLRAEIGKIAPQSVAVFPSLDDNLDLSDVIFFFKMTFSGGKKITDAMKELIEAFDVSITSEQFALILPIVEKFVCWFKSLV